MGICVKNTCLIIRVLYLLRLFISNRVKDVRAYGQAFIMWIISRETIQICFACTNMYLVCRAMRCVCMILSRKESHTHAACRVSDVGCLHPLH
jgi:hypothetical protein